MSAADPARAGAARDLRAAALEVAEIARRHAGSVDRDSRFPEEAIAAARSGGLLGAIIPSGHGGYGAGLSEAASLCSLLGSACSSTGMIVAMHLIQCACLVRHGRGEWAARILREIAAGRMLIASSTTEGAAGGDLGRSACAVERSGDEFTLEKSASVVSYGVEADAILATARASPDASPSSQVLLLLEAGQYELGLLAGWDALGMRGTASCSFDLKARAPVANILEEPYHSIHAATMEPAAHVLWGAVWAGIAADALERARRRLRLASRGAGPQPVFGSESFARGRAALALARNAVVGAAQAFDAAGGASGDIAGAGVETTALKINVSQLALEVASRALEACGLSGYRLGGEFSVERHLRDLWSAPLMINNTRLVATLQRTGLLEEVSPWLS